MKAFIRSMEKPAFPDALASRNPSIDFAELRLQADHSVGQAVRIKSGQLSGLEGVVVKNTADGHCIVQLVELGPGVLATLHPRQLTRS